MQVEEVWAELESSVADSLAPDQRTEAIDVLSRIEHSLVHATTTGSP